MRVMCLFSGGKDSCYALHRMLTSGFEVPVLLTMRPKDVDSWLYQTPGTEVAHLFNELTGIHTEVLDSPAGPKEEEEALSKALSELKQRYRLDAVCSGALLSDYQRMRFTSCAYENGLISYAPLWRKDGRRYMEELNEQGFVYVLLSYSSAGFTPDLLGNRVDDIMLRRFLDISGRWGSHPAFEGGEAETLVLEAPLYKGKLEISGTIEEKGEFNARYHIEEASVS